MVLDRCLGVDDAALVREGHVGACQDIAGDGLSEYFDAEDVCDDLFGFSFDIGVDEGDTANIFVLEREKKTAT